MAKLLVGWKNYSTCEDCAYHLKRDVNNSISYTMAGICMYPYLTPYPLYWWLWHIWYIYCMADHLYMLCYPRSPPLLLFLTIYWISLAQGPAAANTIFITWKKDAENDKHFHAHGNSLAEIEQRARDKINIKSL